MPLSASVSARLQYQHQTIRELIAGYREESLRKRTRPDKWSSYENIGHLAAYQPVFLHRLEKMRSASSPEFERYLGDNDPLFHALLEKPIQDLLADIDDKRNRIVTTLRDTDEEMLQRTGLHPKYGLFTMAQWTEFFLLHESHHLYTIFMILQELRTGGQ